MCGLDVRGEEGSNCVKIKSNKSRKNVHVERIMDNERIMKNVHVERIMDGTQSKNKQS